MNIAEGLVEVLLDTTASVAERDDAAKDLWEYSTPKVVKALLTVAQDPNEDDLIASSAGESLGQIWSKQANLDINLLNSLSEPARYEALAVLKTNKLEWIQRYDLEKDKKQKGHDK